jgi:Protein of unknown function (DUF3592)
MTYFLLFTFSAYHFFKWLLSDDKNKLSKIDDWKFAEGVIFRVDREVFTWGNQERKITLTIRFITEKSEWITGEPLAYTYIYSSFSNFEIDKKVDVFYNPNNPQEFVLDRNWFVKIGSYLIPIICSLFIYFSFMKMIESGFADKILRFFGF